jgi:PncC family amidohydrolase
METEGTHCNQLGDGRKENLVFRIADILRSRGWKLACAESCTGGLLAHRITNVPGSSDYFLGAVVAYDNQVKMEILHVPAGMLGQFGAVSGETVRAMAEGVRDLLSADIAVSTSGVAGPGGGSIEKPVGTTWIGVAGPAGTRVVHFCWDGDREQNKTYSAEAALELLLEYLEAGENQA